MQVKVLSEVATEPVSMAQAKSWLNIDPDFTADDLDLAICISAARAHCEKYVGMSFKEKVIQAQLPYTNANTEELPHGPLIGVDSVLNPEGLVIVSDAVLGSTWIAEYLKGMSINNTWKEDYWSYGNYYYDPLQYLSGYYYTITYRAGFNAENPLPADLMMALQKTIMEFFENRGNTVIGMTVVAQLPLNARALMDLHKKSGLLV